MTAIVTMLAAERVRTPDGKEHTGPGATHAAARHLIATGHDPAEAMHVMRGPDAVLLGHIDTFAKMGWGGAERDPQSAPYRPHPKAELPPLLAGWWKGVQAAREAATLRRNAAKPNLALTATADGAV